MCRIAGIIDFSNPDKCRRIDGMRDAMLHGGPDDAGSYLDADVPLAFGVRRLALIDLSANGHQPMLTPDEQLVVAFNGEIYNFRELKAQLTQLGHHFQSGTDTEVILYAYREWGKSCFEKFNGMFAIALFDKVKNSVILARDEMGMKPLYLHLNAAKKTLVFASEIRAFRQLDMAWPEFRYWRIHFLAYGFMPEPYTTLEDVILLPAGSVLECSLSDFAIEKSHAISQAASQSIHSAGEAEKALREKLKEAVRLQLLADAPVGVFLSGGLDSSIVAQVAAEVSYQPISTISLDFAEPAYSEGTYQKTMAAALGSVHHAFSISRHDFEEHLPDILAALDQPSNDAINSYFICKYASQVGLKAVLSGVGADELMGGYPSFTRQRWVNTLRMLGPLLGASQWFVKDTLKRLDYLRRPGMQNDYLFHRGFFTIAQIAALCGYTQKEVADQLGLGKPQLCNQKEPLLQAAQLEMGIYLKNQLLRDTDVMSMWHSLEVRIPFLDVEVLRLCNRIAPAIRYQQNPPKKLLVDTFRETLPAAITSRKKKGFTFPFSEWMKHLHLSGACHPHYFLIRKSFLKNNTQWSRYWAYLQSSGAEIVARPSAKRILFVSLRTFSAMGGIEKFNRAFALALKKNANALDAQVSHVSLYDTMADKRYFSTLAFRGFGNKKWDFLKCMLHYVPQFDVLVAGHIHLGAVLFLQRLRKPGGRRILIAHGIEVWQRPKWMDRLTVWSSSEIWSVSNYTRQKILSNYPGLARPIHLFYNTLDPFFTQSTHARKLPELLESLKGGYLLTISRLSYTEQYKGYDLVIKAMPALLRQMPGVKYVLGGSWDASEILRIRNLIKEFQLENHVYLPGFVPEGVLKSLYENAGAFVMPSRKEGFGIVFCEAAWCGTQVIAGNADGSPEALMHGKWGQLINPSDEKQLLDAIIHALNQLSMKAEDREKRRKEVEEMFGFGAFCSRQCDLLNSGEGKRNDWD